MEMFSKQFYALVAFVCVIVSMSITVSIANAQKMAKPVDPAVLQKAIKPGVNLPNGEKPRCEKMVSVDFASRRVKPKKTVIIGKWKNKVKAVYGKDYTIWSISQKRSVNCHSAGAKNYNCTASANPCRLIKWKK